MKRRSKQNSEYWERRMTTLLEGNEEARLVKNRYRSLRWFLLEKYPEIIEVVGKDAMCDFLKDVVYLDRELRKKTQGEEDETKEELAQEKEIELGYSPHHYQDVRKLSSL